MNQEERKSRMTVTLLLSACVFCVTLITLLLIGITVFVTDRLGLLNRWLGNLNIFRYFLAFAVMSLIGGTLLTFLAGKYPLKSINRITDALHRLASGDYKTRLSMGKVLGSIRPLREMTESFNTLARELEGTEMLRSDFINNFSHEFKTPIVSIAGFASLLKQGNLSRQEQLEYLEIIESESRRLAYMATNVLNMTKVENQAILTDVSQFNLSEQLRTCVLLLERKWEGKKLEMIVELEEHMIWANEELLQQVWLNLIENAVKFSPENQTVEISASEDETSVHVTIRNTGSYIPPEQQEAIFRKFYQVDRSHNTEGNGIGLAVVKRVVELHGGVIRVESNPSATKFTVTLPKSPANRE